MMSSEELGSLVTCFECKEKFSLEEGYKRTYDTNGLCPKCYKSAIEHMFDDDYTLDFVIETQKCCKKLYAEGFIAIRNDSVQMTEKAFRECFGTGPDVYRESLGSMLALSKEYKGVKFTALFDWPKRDDLSKIIL